MDHRSPHSPHFPSPTSPFVPPPSEKDELDRLGAFNTKSTALHTKRSGGRPSGTSSSASAVSFPSSLTESLATSSSSSPSSSTASPTAPPSSLLIPSSKGSQTTSEKDTDLDSPVASSLFLVTEPQEESHTGLGEDDDPTGRDAALGLSPLSAGQTSSPSHPSSSASSLGLGLGLGSRSSPQPIIISPLANQAPGSPHPPQTEPHKPSSSQRELRYDHQSDSHDTDPSTRHVPSANVLSSPPVKEPEVQPILSPSSAFSQSQSINPPSSSHRSPSADDGQVREHTPSVFSPPPRTTDPDTSPRENPSRSPDIKIRDFAYSESNALHRKPMEPRANRSSTADGLEHGSQTEGRAGGSRTKTAFGWGEFNQGEVDENWEDESDYDDDEDEDDQDEETPQGGVNTEGGHGEEEEDCIPGLYKALYAFQSEAPSELSLSEGDLINVHRSGGIGWVIATLISPNGEPVDPVQQGLVPRGYLRQVDRP